MAWDFLQPDITLLTRYLNFLTRFTSRPAQALSPYRAKGEIAPDLVKFTGLGVLVSIVITFVPRVSGTADDPSRVLAFLGALPRVILPVLAVLVVFGLVTVMHVFTKVWMSVERTTGHKVDPLSSHFGGAVQDSLNAGFAFAAWYLPLATLVFSSLLVLRALGADLHEVVLALAGSALACTFMIYFPLALAGTHPNTSGWNAFFGLCTAIVLALLLIRLAEGLL